ncbi:NAD-glutamate dehydrogenase domain-containing protein, partial [uncultured Abyssibacter sp.]|uniref:NAD-glutamate dehydrogenase domain-containing protein n=1 Tax=uncultured Abyssibacter sp. TaxID=2320202 RepID=UPI0032B1C9DC
HGDLIRAIVERFESRFDPDRERPDSGDGAPDSELLAGLDALESLDADRLLRGCLAIVDACLRTNYYQQDADGQPKAWIALKLDPGRIPELPKPLPAIETFVYAPDVEGVHLRGGMVARGGLRWSDRREDFRTEVLGLMKAQMVKNAVIVPVGAKGGFVVKRRTAAGDREAWQQAGVACYRTFIRGLLDITDNRVGDDIIKPDRVVCRDGDDPYLVVAADKGTATFSDIANGIAEDYGFWLGDAFASGGKAGYDHKKMGITARSAWESVKRHFREMGHDTQREPFTVVGIGDMSGDVFGNGMLLSEQIRLVGAFNHLHIFIDPDPDPALGFAERKRLFEMGRSSWSDYDPDRISAGGGVFERSAKRIELNDAIRGCLGIDDDALRPDDLIRAMLRAPVDLLWNGGIGTYVRASGEANAEVGDRANDALRITARELRCKVVGEGGNLGLTQRSRIEFALNGGRLNTDAIDNVGGVASSDREVNIKIPLNEALRDGSLDASHRNTWLAEATDAVADAVLEDAYQQGRAISMMAARAAGRLDEHAHLIRTLERRGLLDRSIEFLPGEDEIAERRNQGIGLMRPELAVLLAYSKIALFQTLLDSDLPDDPGLEPVLTDYFPDVLRSQRPGAFARHRLRRELIATQVTNHLVDTMGMVFPHRVSAEQGVSMPAVARAFVVASRVLRSDAYFEDIEALDGQLSADVQYELMGRITGLIKHACTVFLLHPDRAALIQDQVDDYRHDLEAIEAALPDLLSDDYRADWDSATRLWQDDGVPEALAQRVASTRVLGPALDISTLRQSTGRPLELVARTFFHVGEAFSMLWMHRAINGLEVAGRWPALARATLRGDAYRLHGLIAGQVLRESGDDPETLFAAWFARREEPVRFALQRIGEIRESSDAADFLGLSVAVRELRKLRLLEQ